MKFAHLVLISMLSMTALTTFAGRGCGIYANRKDFEAGKITFAFDDCGVEVTNNKDIVALHKNQKVRFKFDFIFGYTDGKDTYRGYGNQSPFSDYGFYRVIYKDDLVLYSRTYRDHRAKTVTGFYYSIDEDSPIMPLKRKFYKRNAKTAGNLLVRVADLREYARIQGYSALPGRHVSIHLR